MTSKKSMRIFGGIFVVITVILFCLANPLNKTGDKYGFNEVSIIMFFVMIFGVTAVFLITLWMKLKKFQESILDTNSFLRELKDIDISLSYYKIKDKFLSSELKDSFIQFDKTIRKIKNEISEEGEQKVNYYSTIDAGYFFSEELVTNRFNSKLHNYIPSLLTAIGIFGTFLGLVSGLSGLNLDNVEGTKESIKLLISGVNISFKSSLYGVAYSMVLTFCQKLYLGELERSINELASNLDAIFPKNTQEDGVKEIFMELEKQTSSLQKLATDFAEEVGKKFDVSLQEKLTPTLIELKDCTEKLAENLSNKLGDSFNESMQNTLAPTLIKLGDATEKLANLTQNSNDNAINEMVKNVREVLTNAASTEMNNLKESLGELTSKNQYMFDNFSKAVENVQAIMDRQSGVISETSNSAENVERTNEKIQDLTNQLGFVIEKLSDYSKVQEASNGNHMELLNEVKGNIEYQAKANVLTNEMIERISGVLSKQENVVSYLDNTTKSLSDFNEQFRPILQNIYDSTQGLDRMSKEVNVKFVESISQLQVHYEKINDSIENSFNVMKESVQHFKTDIMDNFKVDIIDNLDNVNKQYADISNNLRETTSTAVSLSHNLKEFTYTQETSQKLWSSYKESFDILNGEINSGVVNYTNQVRTGLNDIFKQYEEHITSVLSKLNSTIEELSDNIEELSSVNM